MKPITRLMRSFSKSGRRKKVIFKWKSIFCYWCRVWVWTCFCTWIIENTIALHKIWSNVWHSIMHVTAKHQGLQKARMGKSVRHPPEFLSWSRFHPNIQCWLSVGSMLNQSWRNRTNIGSTSAQHQPNIESMSRDCWEGLSDDTGYRIHRVKNLMTATLREDLPINLMKATVWCLQPVEDVSQLTRINDQR